MWKDLISVHDGAPRLAAALDIPLTTLWRVIKGKAALNPAVIPLVQALCSKHEIPFKLTTPRNTNLVPLRVLGEELAAGLPQAARVLEQLRAAYPQEQLIELAENNNTPEDILRAVTALLEDT